MMFKIAKKCCENLKNVLYLNIIFLNKILIVDCGMHYAGQASQPASNRTEGPEARDWSSYSSAATAHSSRRAISRAAAIAQLRRSHPGEQYLEQLLQRSYRTLIVESNI